MTVTDVLSRISMIQQQLDQLSGATTAASGATTAASGATTGSTAATTGSGVATTGSTTSTAATGATDFADALAQAQAAGGASASASAQLTSGQQQFAQTLASDTGLAPGVVSAWLLSEESGSAAQGRQAAGNNDWLNVGYTGSGDAGTSDSIWSNPVTAAEATAGWLKGEDTVPGYGTASSSIQAILQTAGQTPQTQIAALQDSGWAASGYPDLPQTYSEVAA